MAADSAGPGSITEPVRPREERVQKPQTDFPAFPVVSCETAHTDDKLSKIASYSSPFPLILHPTGSLRTTVKRTKPKPSQTQPEAFKGRSATELLWRLGKGYTVSQHHHGL